MGEYWKQVHASGLEVPEDRPLGDLTAELTTMLGDTDPEARDGTAYPTLATWVRRGVYDDLLAGLGDGMAAGLGVGLGERETDSVFRRSFSALVLGECIARDNERPLVAEADQRLTAAREDAEAGLGEEVIVAEVDVARMEDVRRNWPFLRDRRIDAYSGIERRYLDD